jgi:ribA/ribD-fused uncharacterized protein
MVKERATDTHFYFVGGFCSQWYPSLFRAPLVPGGPVYEFNCCEQYQMAGKAQLMGDLAIRDEIISKQPAGGNTVFFHAWDLDRGDSRRKLASEFRKLPTEFKVMGREIEPWDQKLWDENDMKVVFVGNFHKFTQNALLTHRLLNLGDRKIVEGASYDQRWGVGLDYADPRIEDERNWRGHNKLGRVVKAVQGVLFELQNPGPEFDPFAWTPTP